MTFLSVQYLRAVAALMVVVYHLQPQLERMGVRHPPGDWLMSGVDIFFVISGFIMWWTTRDDSVTPGTFARKRVHRIVPLYWALTLFYVVILLVAPRLMQTGALEPAHVAASFLFYPWPHPVVDYMMPLVTPGWTLNYEIFFYAIFALALFAPRRQRLTVTTAVLAGLALVGLAVPEGKNALSFYTSTLLLEFLAGIWVGVALERRWLPAARLAPALLVAGFLGLAFLPDPSVALRGLVWGGPAALIVLAAVTWESQRGIARVGLPLLLGNASYSIYLSHQMTLSAVGQASRRLTGHLPDWLAAPGFVAAGFLSATGVGLCCYLLLERPLGRLTRPLLLPARSPVVRPGLTHAEAPGARARA